MKVTGRTTRNCILCDHICEEENSKRVSINYIDQRIMNPLNFPIFEQELSLMNDTSKLNDCLLRRNTFEGSAVQLDLTGKRVCIYNSLVSVSSTIKCVILPLLSGYVSTTDKYKRWKHQPDEYYSPLRMIVMKLIHSSQLHLRDITKFQEKVVVQWNPLSKESTSLIIPPVSLRDEIKTNGYGMAIIEILCLSGLLIHTTTESLVESWDLVNDWESRTVYLCMDGLSLDRHRSFQKKLVKLPYAYTKVFKQSIIFQKALTRVIDISGPLHIAFHMLQSLFIIYKDMMKWAQAVVNWKKINVNKVSESFDACRQLCMITLEEVERVAIDLFLIEHTAEIQRIAGENVTDVTDTAAIVIAKMYNEYINNMKSSDNRRLYMFGFIIMATQFRNYWMSTRLGDRITMEHIQNQWIGVHLLSGKHKCVENYLNAIELEYQNIDNISLQEVRMNISVRYHEGNDVKGNAFPLHPLDEVQENVNQWTKRILLGPDEASWKGHSPNVACAHMCINFEESEFVKSELDYTDGVKSKYTHRSTKTTIPKKTLEKQRLYEWVILMFKDEITKRVCLRKDGFEVIKQLQTSITLPDTASKNDALDDVITEMFNETEELENTVLEIHDDYTSIPDSENLDQNIANTNGVPNLVGEVPTLALGNVFLQGRTKMIEMKIPEVRERKQNRILRSRAFFLDINDTVIKMESNIDLELDRISNTSIFIPWYRRAYRHICYR